MTEFLVETEDPSEHGRATVRCYDCLPHAEFKVLANIGGDPEIPELSPVQIEYMLNLAAVHHELTQHDVRVYTWKRGQ